MNIIKQLALISILFLTTPAFASTLPPKGDGKLALFNYHEREYGEFTYREGIKYNQSVLKEIYHILRSRGDGLEMPIDLKLIEMLDNIQDYFGAETVEIISAFRSPSYNFSLAVEGRGVARESLHMQGLAADIHLDEIKDEDIFNYVKELGFGGAGFYPKNAFVHVDTGPPRTWQQPQASARILVGTENNPNLSWSAITDKNIYARGETVSVKAKNNDYKDQRLNKNVWIERFRRGEWTDQLKVEADGKGGSLSPGESFELSWKIPDGQAYGKYRLTIFANKDLSIPPVFSNEFYLKR